MYLRLPKSLKFLIFFMIIAPLKLMAQPQIDLTEGSLFIDGGINARYDVVVLDSPKHSLAFKTDLLGGYFILDYLALGLGIQGSWQIGKDTRNDATSFGLKVFTTYYFKTNSTVFPYVGINVTPTWRLGKKEFQLLSGLDLGFLVSLSENVALDFGLRPEVFFKLYDTQHWKFTLPMGFLGVRVVF